MISIVSEFEDLDKVASAIVGGATTSLTRDALTGNLQKGVIKRALTGSAIAVAARELGKHVKRAVTGDD